MKSAPRTAWFLDVDGPITDPVSKRVTDFAVLDELVVRLRHGEPVVFNTGRSLAWVVDRVVAPLRQRCLLAGEDPDALMVGRLLLVGEKGGALGWYSRRGSLLLTHSRALALPLSLRASLSRIVEERYGGAMFIDGGKETMISVEMADGADPSAWRPVQRAFAEETRTLLAQRSLDAAVRVDETQIAVDLQSRRAGKDLGARRALRWMASRGISADRFVCVGDSASDLEMADAIAAAGHPVSFTFVGPELDLGAVRRAYSISVSARQNQAGTRELLRRDRLSRGLQIAEGVTL